MQTMKMKGMSVTVVTTVGAFLLCAPAFGATQSKAAPMRHYLMDVMQRPAPPTAASTDMPKAAYVYLGGVPIIRYWVSAGGFTPEQRAVETQLRLNNLLSEGPIHPSDVTVEPLGDEAAVLVRGQLLFTADSQTARHIDATPRQIAEMWADHMRTELPRFTSTR